MSHADIVRTSGEGGIDITPENFRTSFWESTYGWFFNGVLDKRVMKSTGVETPLESRHTKMIA